jgi:hypothetical protein
MSHTEPASGITAAPVVVPPEPLPDEPEPEEPPEVEGAPPEVAPVVEADELAPAVVLEPVPDEVEPPVPDAEEPVPDVEPDELVPPAVPEAVPDVVEPLVLALLDVPAPVHTQVPRVPLGWQRCTPDNPPVQAHPTLVPAVQGGGDGDGQPARASAPSRPIELRRRMRRSSSLPCVRH